MPHFKRHRPKNRRSGCLLCRRWKVNGFNRSSSEGQKFADFRRQVAADDQLGVRARQISPSSLLWPAAQQLVRADALGARDPLRGSAIVPRRSAPDPLGG